MAHAHTDAGRMPGGRTGARDAHFRRRRIGAVLAGAVLAVNLALLVLVLPSAMQMLKTQSRLPALGAPRP